MDFSTWFPTVFTGINAVILFLLGQRYKRFEEDKKAAADLKIREMDDRKVLTDQILAELKQVKEDRDAAIVEIRILNQKLITAERANLELTIQLNSIKEELQRLKDIMHRIDPTVLSKGCKLFGTPECPFSSVKEDVAAVIGETK